MLPGVGSLPHGPEIVRNFQLVAAVVGRFDEGKDSDVVDKGFFVSRIMPQPRTHLCWIMFVLRMELRTYSACTMSHVRAVCKTAMSIRTSSVPPNTCPMASLSESTPSSSLAGFLMGSWCFVTSLHLQSCMHDCTLLVCCLLLFSRACVRAPRRRHAQPRIPRRLHAHQQKRANR